MRTTTVGDIMTRNVITVGPSTPFKEIVDRLVGAGISALPVIDKHGTAPFLSPNDLIMDSKGGIYITDPGPRPVVPGRPTYVYYLPAGAKQPIVIDEKIARPNGLTLTLDGKTLIVDDTLGPSIFAYDVQGDGSVTNKRTFAQLRSAAAFCETS